MANFIVAKALAKKLEDRYQNAKDLAVDLRACRDTLPRSGKQIDVSPAGGEKKLPDAISITGSKEASEEEAKPAATAGLSQAFDSAAATMKLAALTATSEDVEELSKTLKMARPSAEAIRQAAPVARPSAPSAPRHAAQPSRAEPVSRNGSGNFLLIIIVLLVLLGIVSIFVF